MLARIVLVIIANALASPGTAQLSVSTTTTDDICTVKQGILCKGPILNTSLQNSAAGCCQYCKATANCTAWGYNSTSKHCAALVKYTSGINGFDVQSGSVRGKMPHGQWPKGQPPVLPLPFRNTSLTLDQRLEWLINNLTLDEKIGLFGTRSGSIPRLAIRTYTYYTECNSGACANGHCGQSKCSTVNLTAFPQSPSMAATFNLTLERLKGDIIGRELRAIALALKHDFNSFFGLSCFSPMINIIRLVCAIFFPRAGGGVDKVASIILLFDWLTTNSN